MLCVYTTGYFPFPLCVNLHIYGTPPVPTMAVHGGGNAVTFSGNWDWAPRYLELMGFLVAHPPDLLKISVVNKHQGMPAEVCSVASGSIANKAVGEYGTGY